MISRSRAAWLGTAVWLVVSGCAGFSPLATTDGTSGSPAQNQSGEMSQNRLEQIFSDQVEAITGPTGAIQSQIDGISIYCISDPANDRMRIVSPISRVAGLDARVHEILLRANFHRARDARYAISEGVIFSVFLHPLSSLTAAEIEAAVEQVINLVKTFGTTFSSDGMIDPAPIPDSDGSSTEPAAASPLI